MFFKKKKKILEKDNIKINCHAKDSDEAIQIMGDLLLKSGYIKPHYIEGMFERDHSLSVYIGNDIAIPHGEYEYQDDVIQTGIAIMIYPDGIDWHGEKARIVIGIAAKGTEQMEVLAHIATTLHDPKVVEDVVNGDVNFIYQTLSVPGK